MRMILKLLMVSLAFLFIGDPLLADSQPVDQAAKDEAEYQKFIKDHVGYKLLLVEHDKFKNETKVSVDPRMSNELEFQKPGGGGLNIDLGVYAHIPDQMAKDNGGFVNLMIDAHGRSDESWRYLDCKELNWLVDGAAFPWDDEDYDNNVFDDGSTSEYFTISLTPEKFSKLVKAQKIEVKICNDEFDFVKKQMWVMRWVNEQVQALLAKPATAP